MLAALTVGEELNHYRDSIFFSEDAPKFMVASKKEYDALLTNRTWKLVILPRSRSMIKSKWNLKIKPAIKNRKRVVLARFMAKGFSQVPGVDYNDGKVYVSVVKHD